MVGIRTESTRPSMHDAQSPIAFLRSPHAIRQRAEAVLAAGLREELAHFRVDLERLPAVVERVVRVTRRRYPDLRVPWPSRLDRLRLGGPQSNEKDKTCTYPFEKGIPIRTDSLR